MMNEIKYREAEKRLWDSYGLTPRETMVTLPRIGVTVRVQEVGQGDPVLFIHGGPNAGSTWAPMVKHLTGLRCLLVDRPGTGLSDHHEVTADTIAEFGARFVGDMLDGLGVDRAHLVVSSFGGHLALRSAAVEPERIRRMVQMAAPAAGPGQKLPPFMKLMAFGMIRRAMGVLPPSRMASENILRQIGHGVSLDEGRIPDVFWDWYLALGRYTNTMRNDGELIGRHFVPNLERIALSDQLLGSVRVPTLFLWGEDDGFGGEDAARLTVNLMPQADLVMIPHSGHCPWLDEPELIARATLEFLSESGAYEDRASSVAQPRR